MFPRPAVLHPFIPPPVVHPETVYLDRISGDTDFIESGIKPHQIGIGGIDQVVSIVFRQQYPLMIQPSVFGDP